MRGIWIDEPVGVISYDNLRSLNIGTIFFSERRHTRGDLQQARGQGFQVGLYTNPEWYDFPEPKAYRDIVRDRLTALGVNTEPCEVQFNIEKVALLEKGGIVSPAEQNRYVLDLLYWWRRSNAKRASSWTMEGHQGGWFTEALRAAVGAGFTLAPQAYHGNMTRWDSFGVVKDLVDWGIPFDRVFPFYDTPEARVAYSEGYFYHEHRLY